jgi:hypothetical protein
VRLGVRRGANRVADHPIRYMSLHLIADFLVCMWVYNVCMYDSTISFSIVMDLSSIYLCVHIFFTDQDPQVYVCM